MEKLYRRRPRGHNVGKITMTYLDYTDNGMRILKSTCQGESHRFLLIKISFQCKAHQPTALP
jgi:hypothetical protein